MDQTQRHRLASQISQGKLDPRTLSEDDQVEVLGYVMFHHSLFKGEAEGHPFRGNQWTDGQGNASSGTEQPKSRGSRKHQDKMFQTLKEGASKPSWDPKSHPMYTHQDYSYLHDKGYSDSEIKDIWDRDHAEGEEPVTENKNQSQRDQRLLSDRNKYIREHSNGEGLYEHLTSKGYSDEEIDSVLNQAHFDYTNNNNQSWDPKTHPMYHPADYEYLSDKGYSDSEIKGIWDSDHSEGKKPLSVNKDKPNKIYTSSKTTPKDPFKSMSDSALRRASRKATSLGHSTTEIKAEQARRRKSKRSPTWKQDREKQVQDILDAQKIEQENFFQKISLIKG